jgi:hypothetical protein
MAKPELNALSGMNRGGLSAAWSALYKEPLPVALSIPLLRLALAHRLQASAKRADLSPAVTKRLEQCLADTAARVATPTKTHQRYLREWKGELHVVDTTSAGYQYRETTYRSLSEIARRITGTRWSGPLFFGLKQRAAKTSGAREVSS